MYHILVFLMFYFLLNGTNVSSLSIHWIPLKYIYYLDMKEVHSISVTVCLDKNQDDNLSFKILFLSILLLPIDFY